jgi:hypothetical protein
MKVVLVDPGSSDDRFRELWQEDGIYYIYFAGHGTKYGLKADPFNGTAVNTSEVSPPYKLALIALYACRSADAHPTGTIWADGTLDTASFRQHVSDTGWFLGYHGNAYIWDTIELYEGPGDE